MKLKVKKLREGAKLPKRMTDGAAGFDLSACIDSPVTIQPDTTEIFPTGIAVQLQTNGGEDHVLLAYARSSLALKHSISPANCVGVIDSDYRGEIFIPLHNYSKEPYTVVSGERIAQLVVTPVLLPDAEWAEQLDGTERGKGGFGSTGKA